jgi:hypothetical protein
VGEIIPEWWATKSRAFGKALTAGRQLRPIGLGARDLLLKDPGAAGGLQLGDLSRHCSPVDTLA